MQQRRINPWTWQDQFGFSHAIEVTGGERVVYCAGQTASDSDGSTVAIGDMAGQLAKALDNLEEVLAGAGLDLRNVVRLNYYVTDVDAFLAESGSVLGPRFAAAGIQPSSTLLGVARLAFPEYLVEIEATAVA